MAKKKSTTNLNDQLLAQYGCDVDDNIAFSLEDVGSSFVYQLATDIHTSAGSVFRELTKNSYDSYLELPATEREEASDRGVVISRSRDARGHGKLLISDSGNGRSPEELKRFLQIGLTPATTPLDTGLRRTGFRGIGSWAMIACGSQIIISSQRFGTTKRGMLIINVEQIYKTMLVSPTLEAILNNPSCVRFGAGDYPLEEHGTKIEIRCDGDRRWIGSYELNRLFKYTDPEETELKSILLTHCQIAFSKESPHYKEIAAIYKKAEYLPVPIFLDGEAVEKKLSSELSVFDGPIIIGASGKKKPPQAIAWVAENPDTSGTVAAHVPEELVGIQLCVVNSPVGPKNIHSENVRGIIPNWYVGEVHVTDPAIKPNADGTGLRGDVTQSFVPALQEFYARLQSKAVEKSREVSALAKVKKAVAAAERLSKGKGDETEVAFLLSKANKETADLDGRKWVNPTLEKQWKAAVKSLKKASGVQASTSAAQTSKQSRDGSPKRGTVVPAKGTTVTDVIISQSVLQQLVSELILKLQDFSLDEDQIEEVLDLIRGAVPAART